MHEATNLEAYSLALENFQVLPFNLPHMFSNSVSFVGKMLTVVACRELFGGVGKGSETRFDVKSIDLKEKLDGESSCPSVLFGNKVYWVAPLTGDLVTFDIRLN